MKISNIALFSFFPVLFLALPGGGDREKTSVKGGNLVFAIKNLDKKEVKSADFKDKVVLVDIFGTWCPPCRAAIPHLVEYYNKYHSKGLEVIGVSFEKEKDEAKRLDLLKKFIEKNEIKYPVLLGGMTGDVNKVFNDQIENFGGFPTLIFIGRDGKVEEVEVGFDDRDNDEGKANRKKLEDKVVELLNKKASPASGKKPH